MIKTTIHNWWGPVEPASLGEELTVVDNDVTVVYDDEMSYGVVQVRITDEGVVFDLVDSDGVVVSTECSTWDEVGLRLAVRLKV